MRASMIQVGIVLASAALMSGQARAGTDPVGVDPRTGANFNRYAYANNNPYTYVDPDGRLGTRVFHQGESAHVTPTSGPPHAVLPTYSGFVTSPYGVRVHPVTGVQKLHNGTDFRARMAAPIISTQDGKVHTIHSKGPGGNQIIVSNYDGSMSGYAHVTPASGVVEGAPVERGMPIGKSDGSGRITAPHLHYTYKPGTWQAPAQLSTPTLDPMQTQLKRYSEQGK